MAPFFHPFGTPWRVQVYNIDLTDFFKFLTKNVSAISSHEKVGPKVDDDVCHQKMLHKSSC